MRRCFIVGCPRSGTAQVQAMLAQHPEVMSLAGTGFFQSLHGDLAGRWGEQPSTPRHRLALRLGLARREAGAALQLLESRLGGTSACWRRCWRTSACVARFTDLLDGRARAAGCSAWVERTPCHLLYIDDIERQIPEAHFVHVVRAADEVLASVAAVNARCAGSHAIGGSAMTWSRRWNHAMRMHWRCAQRPRHHFVFLDALVRQPEREWQALCDFLGMDANARLGDGLHETLRHRVPGGTPPAAESSGPAWRARLRQHRLAYEALRRACRGEHAAETVVCRFAR